MTPINGHYGGSTARAVLAFRKVNGFARTTSAGRTVFRRLARGGGGFKAALPEGGQARRVRLVAPGARARARVAAADRPAHLVGRAVDADRVRQVPLLPQAPGLQREGHVLLGRTSSAATRSTGSARCRPSRPATAACASRSRAPSACTAGSASATRSTRTGSAADLTRRARRRSRSSPS